VQVRDLGIQKRKCIFSLPNASRYQQRSQHLGQPRLTCQLHSLFFVCLYEMPALGWSSVLWPSARLPDVREFAFRLSLSSARAACRLALSHARQPLASRSMARAILMHAAPLNAPLHSSSCSWS
jgi:hypothetical protein